MSAAVHSSVVMRDAHGGSLADSHSGESDNGGETHVCSCFVYWRLVTSEALGSGPAQARKMGRFNEEAISNRSVG